MKRTILVLAAALLAGPVHAQSNPEKPADQQGSEAEKTKGYGYGTPSGVEAHGSAGQAVKKKKGKRKQKKAPQQEERAAGKQGAAKPDPAAAGAKAPGAAEPQGAQQAGSQTQGGQPPGK